MNTNLHIALDVKWTQVADDEHSCAWQCITKNNKVIYKSIRALICIQSMTD